ncbi:MAG: hypothetical protein GPJ54_19985 [Candidatus Heimdallarchaeota archaeon]|nr:hypothetical protein [Candidatus Heimdallarchaeota archaeon]
MTRVSEENSKKCIIKILSSEKSSLSTSDILEKTALYPELCRDCRSGTRLISVAIKLVEEGRVRKQVAKGGFRWSLIK